MVDWVNWVIDELGVVDVVVLNVSVFGGIFCFKEGWDMNYNVDLLFVVILFDNML